MRKLCCAALFLQASFQVLVSSAAQQAASSLNIEFTDDAEFKISFQGQIWLQSGPLRFFANGIWHQSNSSVRSQGVIRRTGVKRSTGIDDLGSFSSINVSWSAYAPSYLQLHTTLKVYDDDSTVVFLQEVPSGALGTNASNPILPAFPKLDRGVYPPVLSFPSFSASGGKLSHLGYATWQGTMSYVDFGVNAANNLHGLSSNGPVAIFDNDSDVSTIVISPLDNFKNAVHTHSADTNAWETGVSSEVVALPKGFVHRTLLVAGSGITSTMASLGKKLLKLYKTQRTLQDDLVIKYLSYWTDNGAYYYGDQWGEAGGGGASCNEESMIQVADGLRKQDLLDAVKIWQLDDWWYPGPQAVYVHCVHNWTLTPPAFGHNLSWLSQRVQTPWLLYVPFFCPDNVYVKNFDFVLSAPGPKQFAEPHPDVAGDFYSMLFDYGVQSGMRGYENDFLNFNFLGMPSFRKSLDSSREWLRGIDKAALLHNVPVQMCMALPSDLMESVELNSVTNYRASGDYASEDNYDIGGSSLLAFALNLRPSKDNFWTHRPKSVLDTGIPWDAKSNPGSNCELNGLIATLSTGPVGIADKAGETNATLVHRSIRRDGLILQPDRPATYIDAMFLQKLDPISRPLRGAVWTTYANISSSYGAPATWYYALAIDVTQRWQMSQSDFYPKMDASLGWVARRWHAAQAPNHCTVGKLALKSGCLVGVAIHSQDAMPFVLNDRPIMMENDTHVFDLVQFAPIAENGWVLLGETDKYVSVSSKRFYNIEYIDSGIRLLVAGSAGEIIHITALRPASTSREHDWIVVQQNISFSIDGVTSISFMHALDSTNGIVAWV